MRLEKKYKKIYVICPSNYRTGGVELLHQLIYAINSYGEEAICVYNGIYNHDYEIIQDYRCYINDYILLSEIEDSKDNLLIVPEISVCLLKKFFNLDKGIYWESVDNFFFHNYSLKSIEYYSKNFSFLQNLKEICHFFKNIHKNSYLSLQSEMLHKVKYHFCQSDYAFNMCNEAGFENVFMLSDYINDNYFIDVNKLKKEDIVIFNPAKGYKCTKKIISDSKDINFVPLVNLTSSQVLELMQKAKVYIDFGNHPGKDRMPREAVSQKCCILTGINGSASKKYSDVFIPDEYKFDDPIKDSKIISSKIKSIFQDYDTHYKKFDEYYQKTKKEKNQFFSEIKEIFV